MRFLLATHNRKKQAEMQRILEPLGIEVLTADMLGIALTAVEEAAAEFMAAGRISLLPPAFAAGSFQLPHVL